MALEILGQPLQRFTGVMGHVEVVGVGKAVEVRPEESDRFSGNDLNGFVDALRVLAAEPLAEPLKRLPFAEASEGGAGGLANLWVGIAARVLQVKQHLGPAERLPVAEATDGGGAEGRVPIVRRQQQ
jgi:hypothetical protein